MRIACVLKQGPEYRPEHVYALAESVAQHNPGARVQCLTDADLRHPNVEAVPLVHGWPGWWSKLELFRAGLFDGPTLYLDLDTVVLGRLPPIGPCFTMLPNVYRPGDFGSGVMSWRVPPAHVYRRFAEDPERFMAAYKTTQRWGDQGFIRDHLGATPDVFGAEYRSYKVHCKQRVPADTRVVYFHGNPRPWQVRLNHG